MSISESAMCESGPSTHLTYTHSLIRTVSTQSQAGRARTKIAKMQEARARAGAISEGSRLERSGLRDGIYFFSLRSGFDVSFVIAGM